MIAIHKCEWGNNRKEKKWNDTQMGASDCCHVAGYFKWTQRTGSANDGQLQIEFWNTFDSNEHWR